MSAEEITMVVTWPNFSVIIGPCLLDNWAREWWGLLPSSKRFPIMGRGDGPGGRRLFFFVLLVLVERRDRRRRTTANVINSTTG